MEKAVLKDPKALEGRFWREACGELRELQGNCGLWILLYEDSDPAESHRALCDVLRPHVEAMAPVEFTLGHHVLTEDFDRSIDSLMSIREIFDALDKPCFGTHSMTFGRGRHSPFRAEGSGLRP